MSAKIYKPATLFTLLLVVAGCHNANLAINGRQTETPETIPPDALITLERTGCFGSCPTYAITISADGAIVFDGTTKGRAESRITRDQLSQLIAAFKDANYFSLNDRYAGAIDGCPSYWTDQASAITSIRLDGKSKTISHYYGCRERRPDRNFGDVWPEPLFQLERRIDEIVGSAGGSNDNEAEQLVGPERGERVSQLNLLNRRLDVNAAPGQL